ncbi:DUF6446 family protein [Albirhodobacter sp. R86504]|uniref:DUF6446 family protein n=1 Tax=Albirhodobacter sp. R86504 TaxID=3093848 RepID=UPI00366F53FC
MNGKLVGGALVLTAIIGGLGMYYAQVYAFYNPIEASAPAAEIRLVTIEGDTSEVLLTEGFNGIDADSSPLRYRGCFSTPLSLATLSETYKVYADATPLNAPNWFDCFNADAIGADLEMGNAVAFLSEHEIEPGIDRVVAVYPDGRAYAWHQLNENAEK